MGIKTCMRDVYKVLSCLCIVPILEFQVATCTFTCTFPNLTACLFTHPDYFSIITTKMYFLHFLRFSRTCRKGRSYVCMYVLDICMCMYNIPFQLLIMAHFLFEDNDNFISKPLNEEYRYEFSMGL
jgi:hypothetical protein